MRRRGPGAPANCAKGKGGDSPEQPWHPVSLLTGFGILMGCVVSLAKVATSAGVPPIAYAFWQTCGGGLVILAIALWRGLPPPLSGRHLRYYVLAGLTGAALPNAIMFMVVPVLGVGLASIVYTLPPIFTYAFARLLRMEALTWTRVTGILLGCIGTLIIVTPGGGSPVADHASWMLLALIAPVSLAVGNIYRTLDWPRDTDLLSLAAGMLLGAALLLLPVMVLSDAVFVPLPVDRPGAWPVLTMMVATGFAYILFFELQRSAGPVYLSQVGYVVTTFGLFAGLVFFDESYGFWVWFAVALIFVGISLTNLRRPAPPR